MSTWSINGTTRPLLSANRSLTLGARGDSCSLRVNGSLSLTHGTACTVATSDGTFFRGLVRRCAEAKFLDGGVTVLATSIELESKWRLLERLVYTKTTPTGVSDTPKATTRVLLCQEGVTTATELASVISFASGYLSITSTLTGAVAPGWEMSDASVAEVISSLLRFHPEAIVFYDHAADVLRIQPRDATPTLSKALNAAEGAQGGEFATSSPVQVAGIRLIYNITTTVDGVAYRDTVEDTAGATSGLDVVTSTFDWSGGTYQTFRQRQAIETEPIPQSIGATNIKNWVRRKVPELAPFTGSGDFEVTGIYQENPDGEETTFTRELVVGTIQPWMPSGVIAGRVMVHVRVKWGRKRMTDEAIKIFGLTKTREVMIELMGTTAVTKTYTSAPILTGGEDADGPPPTGVAAQIWANRPLPGPQGSAAWKSAMPDVSLHAGARLTVSGCLSATAALIQTVSESCSGSPGGLECTTSVACGPTGFLLSAEPFQQLQRSMARAARHAPKSIAASTSAFGDIDGASKVPGSSGKLKEQVSAGGFQVVMDRPGGVLIREGLIVVAQWPETINPQDPKPVRYAEMRVPSQRFAMGPGQSLWLEINFEPVNYALAAPLGGLTTVSLTGGRGGSGGRGGTGGTGGDGGEGGKGGRGGGGGGGGGPGSPGTPGISGGYGGGGGLPDGFVGGAAEGGAGGAGAEGMVGQTGNPGSSGAIGESGEPGDLPSPISIQIPTSTSLLVRVYKFVGAGVIQPAAGTLANDSSDRRMLVRLAEMTETEIIPHHQGTLVIPPLVMPMVPPPAGEGGG